MGYDVTFHPIGRDELQRFVFDVLDTPALLDDRLAELAPNPHDRTALADIFAQVFRSIAKAEHLAEAEEDSEEDDDDDICATPGDMIPFLAAAVAGCLHPYWYARGAAISFAQSMDVHSWVVPLEDLGHGVVASWEDESPLIVGNYDATGFFPPAVLPAMAARLEQRDAPLLADLRERGIESLGRAIAYARERGLGLIEASDVAVPGGAMFATNPDNIRAHHLDNLDGPSAGEALRRKALAAREARRAEVTISSDYGPPQDPKRGAGVVIAIVGLLTAAASPLVARAGVALAVVGCALLIVGVVVAVRDEQG